MPSDSSEETENRRGKARNRAKMQAQTRRNRQRSPDSRRPRAGLAGQCEEQAADDRPRIEREKTSDAERTNPAIPRAEARPTEDAGGKNLGFRGRPLTFSGGRLRPAALHEPRRGREDGARQEKAGPLRKTWRLQQKRQEKGGRAGGVITYDHRGESTSADAASGRASAHFLKTEKPGGKPEASLDRPIYGVCQEVHQSCSDAECSL